MKYELGKNTTKNLESILMSGKEESAALVKAVKSFIEITPIDFCILSTGGWRTAEQQNDIYKQSGDTSHCDGYKHISEHQKGLAVDLVPWINGKPSWGERSASFLAGAFKVHCNVIGLNVVSGADWGVSGGLKNNTFYDPCHFQIQERV